MHNQALLQETADHIEHLANKRALLLDEVRQVEEELSHAKATHANLTNLQAPIYKLPHELLTNIFLMCHGTSVVVDRNTSHPFEVVASHVSARWRESVLNCALLWNAIDLDVLPQKYGILVQRLLVYLERSGRALLDVSIAFSSSIDVTKVSKVLCYLIPHAHQWYRISICVADGTPHEIFAPFWSLAAPFLIHLSLRIGHPRDNGGSPRTEYPETCPSILTQGSPSLTFVRVAGKVVGNVWPPLNSVKTLHVDAWPKNIMSLAQFRTMLSELPCLVNLSLTGLSIQIPRNPLDTSEPIPLHNLKSLRIRGNSTPCHRLLSLITLPQLESLSLHYIDTFDSTVVPTLRSLTLDSCSLSVSEFRNIFRAFPHVSVLSIEESIPKAPAQEQSNTVWPHLGTMYVRQLQPGDVLPFCLLVGSLMLGGVPLRSIYLDKRSRAALRASRQHAKYIHESLNLLNYDYLPSWPSDLGYEDPDDIWDCED